VKARFISAACLASAVVVLSASAADEKPDKGEPLHEISLDVQALRAFDDLGLTQEQLALLSKLAKETAEPPRKRAAAKASAEYRRVLTALREALIAQDEDKVEELEDELDKLTEKEKPTLDDDVAVTKAARKRAPEVFKTYKASSLAAYYGTVAASVPDPVDHLTSSLRSVRGLEKDEWRDRRDALGEEIAWLVAGADLAKWEKASDKTVALLSKARSLSDEEFKAQEKELMKAAKEVVGDVGPDAVLRHYAERELAELLSNPRLAAALKARMK
jgi:hypothetical protein